MTELKKKRALKPLLVASTGLALLSMSMVGCAEYTGNDFRCADGRPQEQGCAEDTADAGVDGGTP